MNEGAPLQGQAAEALIAAVELLHPDGHAPASLILGQGCRIASSSRVDGAATSDLIVLIPSSIEANSDWLEMTIRHAAASLAPDGLVYLACRRGWRRRAAILLQRSGLVLETPVMHVPDVWSTSHLISLDPSTARYAIRNVLRSTPARQMAARLVLALPRGHHALVALVPWIGLVARRHGARPQCEWLARLDGSSSETTRMILAASWRGATGPLLVYRFCEGSREPSAIAKLRPQPQGAEGVSEASRIDLLGPAAASAGAHVPRVLASGRLGARSVLLETPVLGRRLADALAGRPGLLRRAVALVSGWLEQWNRSTVTFETMPRRRLEQDLFEALQQIDQELPNRERYHAWLAERANAISEPLPLVAAHGDLTMWNLIRSDTGKLGVVDWEAARRDGLPLTDLAYMLVDATAISTGYTSRLSAFQACFAQHGRLRPIAQERMARSASMLKLTTEQAELCFHACWLQHAANEQRHHRAGDARPFLDIARWLAENYAAGLSL